jgi:hypothetical protein
MLSFSGNASPLQLRARAALELHRRREAGELRGRFEAYRFEPARYIVEQLGWQPWRGTPGAPGQAEILDAYALVLRQQHERRDYEAERIAAHELTCWQPGETIRRTVRVEAGHTVGKTMVAAGIVSHFFDCFDDSIGYCFAPGYEQINDLLFKEIRSQRRARGLPGRVLETPELKSSSGDHFVKGRATNNAHGQGSERVQGQHAPYLLFIVDEAEGVEDFVFNAIRTMISGGIAIVVMLANPRTRTSRFHKAAGAVDVVNFRISCLGHPNVLAGREIVPGAVMRDYVESMIDNGDTRHCEVVSAHDADAHTFELPWRPGVIYQPDSEFLFRVLGVAPANTAINVFCPVGRYEAAKRRAPTPDAAHQARIGVDVARWGDDAGTIWVRHNGRAYRAGRLAQLDTVIYAQAVKREGLALKARGVSSLHIRVDGGGGYGGGIVDQLRRDQELTHAFVDFQVFEVNNNGVPSDPKAFADLGSEMYYHAAESLKALALSRPPDALEADLCERTWDWVKARGLDVKQLQPKKAFKKEHDGRSPDDGDGCALAVAPDHLFRRAVTRQANYLRDADE